jgi:DNA-directed RNA polymerase subunit RPC12/RpoP
MNRKKGVLRITIVLCIVFLVYGAMRSPFDGDAFITIGVSGSVIAWICYWGFWFVLRGFNSYKCENCEKNIGNIEEKFTFNEHIVCAECHKKLTIN